jgi:DNA mismatch endonuclease (patch repair protein)
MDIYSRRKRSEIMSKVGATDTAPEFIVRRTLHQLGYRFRLHRKDLPGRPDIVLPRHRAVVFVHGCFWHHHAGCPRSKLPATNAKFWENKILHNVKRDRQAVTKLRRSGWQVIVVWECETKTAKFAERFNKALQRRKLTRQQDAIAMTGNRA